MQTQLVKRQRTNSGQIAVQPGMVSVPVSVHSGVPTSIPNSMTLNMPVQKEVVSTQSLGSAQAAIMPNVQILNMRPGAPAVAAQKAVVTTVPPRVMIGTQQVVGARPAAPVITLQTLQSLQQGQQSHVLIKTDNGQYQLFRVGPAPAANNLTVPQPQTLRLATVPGHSGVAAVSTSAAAPGQTSGQITSAPVASAAVAVAASESLQPVAQLPQPPIVTTQKPSDNTKEKCRNFLANLLDLSSKELKSVERNVRNLIQELIDAQVEPEEFCNRLERLLNASPQPCLIGFLKKSLPLLRQSLITKEMVIEGINPPAPRLAFSAVPSLTQPVLSTVNRHVTKLVPRPGGTAAAPQNAPASAKANTAKFVKATTVNSKASFPRAPGPSGAVPNVVLPGKPLLEDKEKRKQFTSQQYVDDKMAGDDDINDVAAMGGVNLAEETQKILGCSEMIGTQIRSCKDEYLVPLNIMQARIKKVCNKHGLDEPSHEVAALLSHALHERLKNLVEKLAVMGQHHRVDLFLKLQGIHQFR